MADSPAAELRRAASLIRKRAEAVPQGGWQGHPWAVTPCAPVGGQGVGDPDEPGCACIVYQGEYKPFDEPQVPPIQYVADAESEEHAAFIASMHPGVALAVADWLDDMARHADESLTLDRPECPHDGGDCYCKPLPPEWGCGRCGEWMIPGGCQCWDKPLAVARTYLDGAR